MALELRISGPGLDLGRRLQQGDAALVLGRDADCSICLPDPERNVSRRHLSVWNEGEELHFSVLSVVNGVETSDGLLPPGARGMLSVGDALKLSAYQLSVSIVSDDDDDGEPADPWEELARQATRAGGDTLDTVPAQMPEDDPFGDWGFESTFGPGAPGGGLSVEALTPAADLKPFLRGLGVDAGRDGALTEGELEIIGRATRMALGGLLQALQAAQAMRAGLQLEDLPAPGEREGNPLRLDIHADAKLLYLFGGRAAGVGFMAPDRAVGELVAEVVAHQGALAQAASEAVDGTLADFDPEVLKARLLGGGTRLFESARAWDAFVKDYADQSRARPQWVRRLLDRHLAPAYLRELIRHQRDSASRKR